MDHVKVAESLTHFFNYTTHGRRTKRKDKSVIYFILIEKSFSEEISNTAMAEVEQLPKVFKEQNPSLRRR